MLVCPDDCGIDHDVLKIWIFPQSLKNPLPNALVGPAIEPLEYTVPMPKCGREITPWRACSQHPQHRINKQTIVFAVSPFVPLLARHQLLDKLPLGVRQLASNQDRLLKLRS